MNGKTISADICCCCCSELDPDFGRTGAVFPVKVLSLQTQRCGLVVNMYSDSNRNVWYVEDRDLCPFSHLCTPGQFLHKACEAVSLLVLGSHRNFGNKLFSTLLTSERGLRGL